MMADFLKYIRFPAMSNSFLSNDVYFAGILTDKELINIFRAKTLKDKSLTEYTLSKRPRYTESEIHKFPLHRPIPFLVYHFHPCHLLDQMGYLLHHHSHFLV